MFGGERFRIGGLLILATCALVNSAWVGDPTCWEGNFQYEFCCDVPQILLRAGAVHLSGLGNSVCWNKEAGFTYKRCCLAGRSRSEVVMKIMRDRVKNPLDVFLSDGLPDFDCQRAKTPGDPETPATASSGETTSFWQDLSGDFRRFMHLLEEGSLNLLHGHVDEGLEGRIYSKIFKVFALFDAALTTCPLGVAAAAGFMLMSSLTGASDAFGIERYELAMRTIMERFKLTTLALSKWPIFSMLRVLGELSNSTRPLTKYSIHFSDFGIQESDLLQLERLRDKAALQSNSRARLAVLANEAADTRKYSWSSMALSALRTLRYLGSISPQPAVLASLAYGEEYAAVVPQYAQYLRALDFRFAVLACGDELVFEACVQHWWPSSDLCIEGPRSYALKYTVPALLLHAGVDVFVFPFDAVIFKDPREYLSSRYQAHDVALTVSSTYYYLQDTAAARQFMRHLLKYLHEHGKHVLEMWALTTFVSHRYPHGALLPYLPAGDLPELTWGQLDDALFVCSSLGWDCENQALGDMFFFHVHSPGTHTGGRSTSGRNTGALDVTPGTGMSNLSALLSDSVSRAALLEMYCNRQSPPKLGASYPFGKLETSIQLPLV